MQPTKRALLVIDVQQEYFDGALPVSYPPKHLDNIVSVMDAAKSANIATAVVQHHQADPQSPIFRLNSEAWKLHPEIAKRPHDILIDKQLPGAFTGTNLEEWLQINNVETVVIAGYMTHMCCDTTARQAFHRGYKVEFLNDATGTLDVENKAGNVKAQQMHDSILVAQQMFISDVIPCSEWYARLG